MRAYGPSAHTRELFPFRVSGGHPRMTKRPRPIIHVASALGRRQVLPAETNPVLVPLPRLPLRVLTTPRLSRDATIRPMLPRA